MNQPLIKFFGQYLKINRGLSGSSRKNYLSDTNRFLTWLSQLLQQETIQAAQVTRAKIKSYQLFLDQTMPTATRKRHLASLRHFGQFLFTTKRLPENVSQDLINPQPHPTHKQIVQRFQKFLIHEGLAKSTVKNYLSDLNNYLLWAQKNIKKTDNKQNIRSFF